jgi:predicted ATP-grasp superfamily ATP-dependent carboligase
MQPPAARKIHEMSKPLLIVGGSARAAAASARRSGFRPLAVDRYGDVDLESVCDAFRLFRDVAELPEVVREFDGIPWVYTGPLENHAELIDELCRRSPLLGCAAETTRNVRDPWRLRDALQAYDAKYPEVAREGRRLGAGQWLRKPFRSSGGFGVQPVDQDATRPRASKRESYLQRYIDGRSCGATFVANGEAAVLIGVTEQLTGEPWTGVAGFQYSGSIGPLNLTKPIVMEFERIGNSLASNFDLRGLFGVDFVLAESRPWLIEINPRYTASVEILERALDIPAMQLHVAACRRGRLPVPLPATSEQLHGKAIVYAQHHVLVDHRRQQALLNMNDGSELSRVADIPMIGTRIEVGGPVVTVFARGGGLDAVKRGLRDAVTEVRVAIEDH